MTVYLHALMHFIVRGESTTLTVGILISVITVLVIAITLAAIAVLM